MAFPLDIPEILSLVASRLDIKDLVQACQVSVSFRDACIPFLWRTITLTAKRANRVWYSDEGFRLGLTRYGRFVHVLRLRISGVQNEDIEFIAVNCTRLKTLDLATTDITVESLKILLHSDPYKTSLASTDKLGDVNSVNTDNLMEQYRIMAEREADVDQDNGPRQCESVGPPASSIESKQDQHHHQFTGPDLALKPRYTSNAVKLISPERNTGSHGGNARPDNLKGTETRFPFHLEELDLSCCKNLYDPTLLPVLALLGPQLRDLSVGLIPDIAVANDPSDLIRLLMHCPNLTRLDVSGTYVDDRFLAALDGTTKELAPHPMEMLDLGSARISPDGLVPLIKVSRDTLKQLMIPYNLKIKDNLIYAFIEDAKKPNMTLHPFKTFVRNDVLSVLQLDAGMNITHEALLDFFRHTTALTRVTLDGLDVRDDILEALAAANRNRMKRLGLGIPEAWIQHEQGTANFMAKQEEGGKPPPMPVTPAGTKRYDVACGAWVPGGLNTLSLEKCINVTNRGVRAIVRSCPMLWDLNLSGCKSVSMRIFRGPWVCNEIRILNITGIKMRPRIKTTNTMLEEQIEDERFPMTPLLKARPSDDFLDDGRYDFMILPMSMDDEDELDDSHIVDEDCSVLEDTLDTMNMYPPKALRNDGETRRTLNEFYRRLGQFDELRFLHMDRSDYRIRLQDGLDLVLPALTKNLNSELKWLGKHFGYGFDFSKDKDELEQQYKIVDESQRLKDSQDLWNKGPNRVSNLKLLHVCRDSIEHANLDVDLYEWFMKSGFRVDLVSDRLMRSDDEAESEDEWEGTDDELDEMDGELGS
ncbi:hypothetical protein BGZ99_000860 [Dissophora globulifera]|uniref:F-box domain-containing protein n=1 Tax=Dissophora globulifera TaxID=979702 RepID=A0A9P6R211_9FUNG|nr:hypothetical protein BGZ99_000860 [Dissophora globulifera]